MGNSASQPAEVRIMTSSVVHSLLTQTVGGKKFSKNLTPLDAEGNAVSMWGVSIYSLEKCEAGLIAPFPGGTRQSSR